MTLKERAMRALNEAAAQGQEFGTDGANLMDCMSYTYALEVNAHCRGPVVCIPCLVDGLPTVYVTGFHIRDARLARKLRHCGKDAWENYAVQFCSSGHEDVAAIQDNPKRASKPEEE